MFWNLLSSEYIEKFDSFVISSAQVAISCDLQYWQYVHVSILIVVQYLPPLLSLTLKIWNQLKYPTLEIYLHYIYILKSYHFPIKQIKQYLLRAYKVHLLFWIVSHSCKTTQKFFFFFFCIVKEIYVWLEGLPESRNFDNKSFFFPLACDTQRIENLAKTSPELDGFQHTIQWYQQIIYQVSLWNYSNKVALHYKILNCFFPCCEFVTEGNEKIWK